MKHKIGYACINTSISATTNKTCKLENCTEERLRELIENNLSGLIEILKWNIAHNIYLYRISSAIIPFASHKINKISWWEDYKDKFDEASCIIKNASMRVSMHPGQYVNINSPRQDVLISSFKDLEWHANFLNTLALDSTHRLIIHAGGIYGNKDAAMKRFISEFNNLPEDIKKRLSLENDDKSYTVRDVLYLSKETSMPVVFDILHHKINNTGQKEDQDIESILNQCFATWSGKTGIPKNPFFNSKTGSKARKSCRIHKHAGFYRFLY